MDQNADTCEGTARRTVCRTIGAGLLAATAGCLGDSGISGSEEEDNGPAPPDAETDQTPSEYVPLGEDVATFEEIDDWTPHGEVELERDEEAAEESVAARVSGNPGTIELSVSPAINLSSRDITLVARIEQPKETNLRIRLTDTEGETASLVSEYYHDLHPKRWLTFSPSIVDASADLSSIENLLISIDGMDGGRPPLYWLDEIRFPERTIDTAQFSFTFDDNTRDIYETFFPIMREFDFPGAAAIHTSLIGESNRLRLAELEDLADAAWSMENHTHTMAALNGQSRGEQLSEIQTANEELRDYGFEPEAVMYPGGQCDRNTMDVMAEVDMLGFLAFTSPTKGIAPSVAYEESPRFINRSRPGTAEVGKEMIDTVIEYGGTYPAYWHTAGPDGEITEADFREICEYLAERERAGEIEVVVPSELG